VAGPRELATYPQRKLRRRRLSRPGPPAPFIVGMTRSGTTLLRLMLDSHPKLAIPPETHFVPQVLKLFRGEEPGPGKIASQIAATRRFADLGFTRAEVRRALADVSPLDDGLALRAFYDLYARRQGKKRFGEKTPGYGERMKRIEGALPEARFIHMIRDGRDVALSYERKEADPVATKKIAVRWRRRVNATRRQGDKVAHYTEVRYEDLVTDPEGELRRLCEFIELDFRPEMLTYHERAAERLEEIAKPLEAEEGKAGMAPEQRLAAHERLMEPPSADRVAIWRREMSETDQAEFENKAGELLAELGYETRTDFTLSPERSTGTDFSLSPKSGDSDDE
jgi:hypothetical protein